MEYSEWELRIKSWRWHTFKHTHCEVIIVLLFSILFHSLFSIDRAVCAFSFNEQKRINNIQSVYNKYSLLFWGLQNKRTVSSTKNSFILSSRPSFGITNHSFRLWLSSVVTVIEILNSTNMALMNYRTNSFHFLKKGTAEKFQEYHTRMFCVLGSTFNELKSNKILRQNDMLSTTPVNYTPGEHRQFNACLSVKCQPRKWLKIKTLTLLNFGWYKMRRVYSTHFAKWI